MAVFFKTPAPPGARPSFGARPPVVASVPVHAEPRRLAAGC